MTVVLDQLLQTITMLYRKELKKQGKRVASSISGISTIGLKVFWLTNIWRKSKGRLGFCGSSVINLVLYSTYWFRHMAVACVTFLIPMQVKDFFYSLLVFIFWPFPMARISPTSSEHIHLWGWVSKWHTCFLYKHSVFQSEAQIC